MAAHLTRDQAADIVQELNCLRAVHVQGVKTTKRRRSWSPALRAHMVADAEQALERIVRLQDALRDAYDLSN